MNDCLQASSSSIYCGAGVIKITRQARRASLASKPVTFSLSLHYFPYLPPIIKKTLVHTHFLVRCCPLAASWTSGADMAGAPNGPAVTCPPSRYQDHAPINSFQIPPLSAPLSLPYSHYLPTSDKPQSTLFQGWLVGTWEVDDRTGRAGCKWCSSFATSPVRLPTTPGPFVCTT